MRREDLFNAIGMVDNKRLDRCDKQMNPSVVTRREDLMMKHSGKYLRNTRPRSIRKMWLVAAIIVLMLSLMGSAIAVLVSMEVDDVKSYTQGGENHESVSVEVEKIGEKVEFEKTHDVFIELGSYYPQEIPDGYTMTFVSEGAPLQNQEIDYENEEGYERR